MGETVKQRARFVTGSTLWHVIEMTAITSVGLVSYFIVDALNLFYLSLAGPHELAAVIGFVAPLQFFIYSITIGLSIAATALTSRALGRGNRDEAKEVAGASLALVLIVMTISTVVLLSLLGPIVRLLGATGQTAELTLRFTRIIVLTVPLLGIGMCLAALLRAAGAAKVAMSVLLSAAVATAVFDPILILGADLGLDGAAIAIVLARMVMVGVGLYWLIHVHGLFARPGATIFAREFRPFFAIGLPAILTDIANPIGIAFVTSFMANFGDQAVAGWAVVWRIIPVAFCAIYALPGAVGPILGQNYGAVRLDRLRSTMRDALLVALTYVGIVWATLALFSNQIAGIFGAKGEELELIVFFCSFVAGTFLFNGALYVANTAFNNLGFAFYATALSWGRSTLGTIPFAWLGAHWFGAAGVLAGYGLGFVIFGTIGGILCLRVMVKVERDLTRC
jgi:putative MATE family efflux protein